MRDKEKERQNAEEGLAEMAEERDESRTGVFGDPTDYEYALRDLCDCGLAGRKGIPAHLSRDHDKYVHDFLPRTGFGEGGYCYKCGKHTTEHQ